MSQPRVLVIGGGGREHALAWKLAQEAEILAAPGNPGIAALGECFSVAAKDSVGLTTLADRLRPDLVVVGPEDPLVDGLAEHLRMSGHAVFGPGADGAKLEASKAHSKAEMAAAGVPTAHFQSFTDAGAALEFATSRFDAGRGVAVKASGNALGKGVVVCDSLDQAEDAIGAMLVEGELGEAGRTVVVEDRLVGREFSLLTVVSGEDFVSLPVAQDHKRIFDGDRGPNTGGMGTHSPVSWLEHGWVERAEAEVVRPILARLRRQGIDYRGVLFSGLLVEDGKPYCLEYNVRFGDPETQTVLRRVGAGFYELLHSAATGSPLPEIEVLRQAACTVVLASAGYPGKVKAGFPITIGEMPTGVQLFHAGTALEAGQIVTKGGRVLGVSAVGSDLAAACAEAYTAVANIHFEGMQFRRDIGAS